jgi:hypothetical protein
MWLSGDNFEKVGDFFPKRSLKEIKLQAAKISRSICKIKYKIYYNL